MHDHKSHAESNVVPLARLLPRPLTCLLHGWPQAGWPEVGKPGHVGPFIWEAAPDMFEQLTPFEPSLRNPCFHNRTTGALRCLPYFSIIGAVRM